MLRVLDAKTGKGLAGATIQLTVTDARSSFGFGKYQTDAQGKVAVDYPPAVVKSMKLIVSAPGHAVATAVCSPSQAGDFLAEFTVKLHGGVRIGGIVRDDRRKPVHGAKVLVQGVTRDYAGQYLPVELASVTTDRQRHADANKARTVSASALA